MNKAYELLEELEALLEKATPVPFVAKSLVSVEDALEILDEIKQELPSEIEEAQRIVQNKTQILIEAQNDAETLVNEAEKKMRMMIDENEITRAATKEAETILENAQTTAKEIRIGTQKYTDNILHNLQRELNELFKHIENNREEMKSMGQNSD